MISKVSFPPKQFSIPSILMEARSSQNCQHPRASHGWIFPGNANFHPWNHILNASSRSAHGSEGSLWWLFRFQQALCNTRKKPRADCSLLGTWCFGRAGCGHRAGVNTAHPKTCSGLAVSKGEKKNCRGTDCAQLLVPLLVTNPTSLPSDWQRIFGSIRFFFFLP